MVIMSRHTHTCWSARGADKGLQHCPGSHESLQHPTAVAGILCILVLWDVLCCAEADQLPGVQKAESGRYLACHLS